GTAVSLLVADAGRDRARALLRDVRGPGGRVRRTRPVRPAAALVGGVRVRPPDLPAVPHPPLRAGPRPARPGRHPRRPAAQAVPPGPGPGAALRPDAAVRPRVRDWTAGPGKRRGAPGRARRAGAGGARGDVGGAAGGPAGRLGRGRPGHVPVRARPPRGALPALLPRCALPGQPDDRRRGRRRRAAVVGLPPVPPALRRLPGPGTPARHGGGDRLTYAPTRPARAPSRLSRPVAIGPAGPASGRSATGLGVPAGVRCRVAC